MFKKKLFKVIESDEGFSVKILGRIGIRYTEGSKSMFIDSQFLASVDPVKIAISRISIKSWDPPYDKEIIDDIKRERIIDNVSRALQFRGLEVEVD